MITATTLNTLVLLLYNWMLTNKKVDKYLAWILSFCQPLYSAHGQHLINNNTITLNFLNQLCKCEISVNLPYAVCVKLKNIFFLSLWTQPEENLMWTIWSWIIASASYSYVILKCSLTQHMFKISRLLFSALLTSHCQTCFYKNPSSEN
jgi:hypothetical protein